MASTRVVAGTAAGNKPLAGIGRVIVWPGGSLWVGRHVGLVREDGCDATMAALAWMRQRLAAPMRLQEVAAAVHLSPGRFRHLFVAQEAGFADAAHFTRTCRRVFGIAPTMLAFETGAGAPRRMASQSRLESRKCPDIC